MIDVEFRINSATSSDIHSHLLNCKPTFISEIEKRVSISNYADKIATLASTYEFWKDNALIGLIAIYVNRGIGYPAYITSVSITDEFIGNGFGNMLLTNVIKDLMDFGFDTVQLEVAHNNEKAKNLYLKQGFCCISRHVYTEMWELKLK